MMIEKAWRSYEQRIIPHGASRTQKVESKRAFYAGAQAIFAGLLQGVSEGDEVQEADEQLMANTQKELERFMQDVLAGRA